MRLCATYPWEIEQLGTSEIPDLAVLEEKIGIAERLAFDQPWVSRPVETEPRKGGSPTDEEHEVADQVGEVDPKAFHGVLGRLALGARTETEGNHLFVLVHLLAFFAGAIGRRPFIVLSNEERLNFYAATISPSGDGRKGTAAGAAKTIWRAVDAEFKNANIMGGLNSGAGLLFNLRDASIQKDTKAEVKDPGVSDSAVCSWKPSSRPC